ncbi:MAG TPA: hypothetical protein VF159_11375 [Gemmatimonadaceae bacterium]
MRTLVIALILAALPAVAGAQRDTAAGPQLLPANVRAEVVDRWNSPVVLRASDKTEIAQGREVGGDLAIAGGPLVVAGHIAGNVLAVNSDVVLQPTARVDGDILVVGGDVQGRSEADVRGAIRIYREPLRYRLDGDRMVALRSEPSAEEDEGWWRRIERRRTASWSDLRVAQAGAYNRVEGLPVSLGPTIVGRRPWGGFRADAAAVVRTGSSFDDKHGDVGHNVRAEVRFGRGRGIGFGGRMYDIVDPVEKWQLSDLEVALASFLAHRDYRDYYQRHGARGYVTFFANQDVSLTTGFGEERWGSRDLRDPFTLFHNQDAWRPNPTMDEGLFHIANATLRFDTRTDEDDPWSGWYITADMEGGRGTMSSLAPTDPARAIPSGAVSYTRGFVDARRYNHLWPDAQLNLRLVLGGWLNGDPLPLQRRLSVEGPGSLPGFDFRSERAGPDVGTCTEGAAVPGAPAQCDRVALGQLEYRGALHFNFNPGWEDWPRGRYRSSHTDAQWVAFFDAGRGWRVGVPDGSMTYSRSALPPVSSFRTDVGAGLDLGFFGVYGAKSVSTPSQPANFFVRLRHRF